MDNTNVRLIAAIRDRGSISAAARAVHMSPTAAARRITALENELGGILVERTSQSTTLTELGRRYLTWGAEARARFEALPEHEDDPATRTVYVAVLGMALGTAGPAILDEWRARFPNVSLVEVPVTAHSIGDPIAQGADIVFGQLLGDEADQLGWQSHVTARAPRAVVVPAFSDYADATRLSPPELENEHFLYAPAGDARHARWMGDLPVAEGRRDTIVDVPERVARAVEVTGRVGLHTMAAAPFMERPGAKFIPLMGRPVDIGVAIRADEQRPAVRGLFDLATLAHTLDDLDSLEL